SYYVPAGGNDVLPAEQAAVKGRVLASSPEDEKKMLQVVLPELENNPEFKKLGVSYKLINPDDPGSLVIGEGQGKKAITFYAKDPESLKKALTMVDDALAKHGGELPPIIPEGTDMPFGKSGRVAIVRDTYPVAVDAQGAKGALLDVKVADC